MNAARAVRREATSLDPVGRRFEDWSFGRRTVVHLVEGVFAAKEFVHTLGECHFTEDGRTIVRVESVSISLCPLAFLDVRDMPGNIGYDAVAAGGRFYVPLLWDFTFDGESGERWSHRPTDQLLIGSGGYRDTDSDGVLRGTYTGIETTVSEMAGR